MSEERPRKYLTTDEMVARYDGKIPSSTLAYWRTTGQGPSWVKLGKRILYPLDQIEKWEATKWGRKPRG